jgi:hypothetical protein
MVGRGSCEAVGPALPASGPGAPADARHGALGPNGVSDAPWIATARQRLQGLSWFMKCLKEPLSRLAKRQDKTRGALFAGRFKGVTVCDEEALLAISVYIDLNRLATLVATTAEISDYTSIKQRLERVGAQDATARLEAAKDGSVAGSFGAAGLEDSLWLCPIDDRRGLDSTREGMVQVFSLIARRRAQARGQFLTLPTAPGATLQASVTERSCGRPRGHDRSRIARRILDEFQA